MMAPTATAPATTDVDARIHTSVLRTAEMFALTKRNTSAALDFAPRSVLRISFIKLLALEDLRVNVVICVCLLLCVYECSKKIRIHAKLNDMYMNLPESLLDDKPMAAAPALSQPSAGAPQLLTAEETLAASKDVVLGGHEVPSAPGTLFLC